jgi:endonuclease/exonuclease/phosphatase family metal-dependent hydrolase
MTFNVENLLARFKFGRREEDTLMTLLDVESEVERAALVRAYWNVLNDENRAFTALTIKQGAPDVLCLQEVDSLQALRVFHDHYIRRLARLDYAYQLLIEGNDPRGIDVAVLSQLPMQSATTHQHRMVTIAYPRGNTTEPRYERVFRRDCLEVNIQVEDVVLPVFICHFKSMAGGRRETRPVRLAEASAVRHIIESRFAEPARQNWLIVGDLNDYTETDGVPDAEHGLGPLLEANFSVDLIKRIEDPTDRWTHYFVGDDSYHQLDYLLASPALAAKNATVKPTILRTGQPFRALRYTGPRWPRIGYERPKASDHCPVVMDFQL